MNFVIPVIPLIIGFLLDSIIGDPYKLPHPIRLIGRLISALEKFVRAHFKNLTAGGVFLALAVILISGTISFGVVSVCYYLNIWLGMAVESILCYYMIAARCLQKESMKVYRAVAENDTEKARKAVSMIVGRDTAVLDRNGIIRAAVETVAENTSDGVTAPIIYMALFGAVGGVVYKSVNTMDSMIGYRNEKYEHLGKFAAKLDDVLNYLPSRITAVVMIISSFLLGFDGKSAWKIWRRDRRKHASPNSAQTESVCAGALKLRLAGDAYYFGELHKKPYIGDDIRPIENEDIRRANRLMYAASIIILIIFSALRVLIYGGILTWITNTAEIFTGAI
ncbi:MAG: cobalamin biosynthesis protein CobD [Ruminiclostridium sp.]|nr:cobalamin biosynthesis protein CobD [Ruminiclostridium sp.]